MPHQPQDGVVGLGAGIGEERVIEIGRSEFREFGRELDRRLYGALEKTVVVGQFGHLARCGFAQLPAAIAEVHAPQPGESVEHPVAVGVPDISAFAADQDARALLRQRGVVVERVQVMRRVELLQAGDVGFFHDGSGR